VTGVSDAKYMEIMEKDSKYSTDKCLNTMLNVEGASMLFLTGSGDLIVPRWGVESVVNKLDVAKNGDFENMEWTKDEEYYSKSTGNLEMRCIFGAGHLIFVDRPELHATIVTEFLDNAMRGE